MSFLDEAWASFIASAADSVVSFPQMPAIYYENLQWHAEKPIWKITLFRSEEIRLYSTYQNQ